MGKEYSRNITEESERTNTKKKEKRKMAIEKSVEMVLKIKPVYVHLIHRTPYMGPCRYGEGEQLER